MPLSEVIHAYALGPSVLIINPLKNIYENANTLAHGGVHLVVLAYLQRRLLVFINLTLILVVT